MRDNYQKCQNDNEKAARKIERREYETKEGTKEQNIVTILGGMVAMDAQMHQ
jgi:hypothetical protein